MQLITGITSNAIDSITTEPDEPKRCETDELVDRFAEALKAKLRAAETKHGWGDGWKNDGWADVLRKRLSAHVVKGDPRDVAAFCAFAWHHGWSVGPAPDDEVPHTFDAEHMAWETYPDTRYYAEGDGAIRRIAYLRGATDALRTMKGAEK